MIDFKGYFIITICSIFFSISLLGNKQDTSISLKEIYNKNNEKFDLKSINENIDYINVFIGDTIVLSYKQDTIFGERLSDGYFIVKEKSYENFKNFLIKKFNGLDAGHDKNKSRKVTINKELYEYYANSTNGWQTEILINNIGAKYLDISTVFAIKAKANLRDAIFSILVEACKSSPNKNIAIERTKLKLYEKANHKIQISNNLLLDSLSIPKYPATGEGDLAKLELCNSVLKTLIVFSFLLNAFLVFMWFFRWRQIVVPYKDNFKGNGISDNIEKEAMAQEEKNTKGKKERTLLKFLYGKNKFSASSLFTILKRNFTKDKDGASLNEINLDLVKKINNHHQNSKKIKEVEGYVSEFFGDYLKLDKSFISKIKLGEIPAPINDKLKEILEKADSKEQIKKAIKYIDEKYSKKLTPRINELYKASGTLVELSGYLKIDADKLASKLNYFSGEDKRNLTDLINFIEVFNPKQLPTLIEQIQDNETKAKSYNTTISDLSALSAYSNTGLNLIRKTKQALIIIKGLSDSKKINFIEPCIEELANTYVIKKVLSSELNKMEMTGRDAVKKINEIFKLNLVIPEKEKIIEAFVDAQLAKESKTYLSNYFKRYSTFFSRIGEKDLDIEKNLTWVTQQLIEMAIHRLDFSSIGKRGFSSSRVNFLTILEGNYSKVDQEFTNINIDTSHSNFIDKYHVRNIIKYAQKLKVKSLKGIFIDGYLISDEVLQTGKGSITKYTRR